MKTPIIREVSGDESELCAEIIRKSFAAVAAEFGLTKENCPTNGAFIQKENLFRDKNDGIRQYLLFHNGRAVGFFALRTREEALYELEKLAVLPECRHLGYGKAMIERAKELVNEFGGRKITIGIIEENTSLKNWYIQNGFIHIKTAQNPRLPFTIGYLELPLYG